MSGADVPVSLPVTPSQTAGPYLAIGMTLDDGPFVVPEGSPGAITISGRLIDGAGEPVPDGGIETWQADPDGRVPTGDSGFRGFGRSLTDTEGRWRIVTRKPGAVTSEDGTQAPHIDVSVFSRGLLTRLVTRIYFPDEAVANAADPVLRSLPDDAARATLTCRAIAGGYEHDIRLQGDGETVFFRLPLTW